MITYLIKTIACSGLFLLVYLLFLEKEKMHRFNRWYLLGSIALSFIIPLIQTPVAGEILPVINDSYIINWDPGDIVATQAATEAVPAQPTQAIQSATGFPIPVWLLVYGLVTLILLARFIKNIYTLAAATWNRKIIRYKGVPLIVIKGDISSYTFFNTIFISEADYPAEGRESAVLTHELAHVKQKHSWDVLFIELVKVFCWFNPIFILYKKAIQLNHEFLADTAVIDGQTPISAYQHLLLDKLSRGTPLSLTSSFNYSITKKRLLMMSQQQNKSRSFVKQTAGVLTAAVCLVVFSTKKVLSSNKESNLSPVFTSQKDTTPKQKDTATVRRWPMGFLKGVPYTQEGLSAEELKEYRDAEEKYVIRRIDKKPPHVTQPQLSDELRYHLEAQFKKMNREQQQVSRIIFMPPLKPYIKNAPTEEQMKKWTTNKDYGIWVDNKRIKNEALSKYQAADFSYYDASKLSKNAINYPYHKVQLDLMTNEAFAENNKRLAAQKHFSMAFMYHRNPKSS